MEGRHKSAIPWKKCKVAAILSAVEKYLMLYRVKTDYRKTDKSVNGERSNEK